MENDLTDGARPVKPKRPPPRPALVLNAVYSGKALRQLLGPSTFNRLRKENLLHPLAWGSGNGDFFLSNELVQIGIDQRPKGES